MSVDLRALTDRSDGVMDEVHAVRDEHAADLVGLITAHKDFCGRAWVDASAPYGFSITGYNCEIGDYSFAHELGHNMGLHHDRYAEKCSGAEYRPGDCDALLDNRPHPYAYGYVNQRAFDAGGGRDRPWMTIMAYDWQCQDAGFSQARSPPYRHCIRTRYFSNPDLSFANGDRRGVFGSETSQQVTGPSHAARTLNQTRVRVANFRQSRVVTSSCSLEHLGALTGAVTRTGSLGHDCVSPNYTGELARYYSFTLSNAAGVTIDMTSSAFDAWLTLRQGADISGSVLHTDDDGGGGSDARIAASLSAGAYTIEATSAAAGLAVTGPFTLTVATSAGSVDLVVSSPTVSDHTLTPDQSFTLSATVRNEGSAAAAATPIRYYESADAEIGHFDAQVGAGQVPGLAPGGESLQSIALNAPALPGAYYYGACVDGIVGESNALDNCSDGVAVTVISGLSDRVVLEALYNATGGPSWTNGTNWLSSAPLSAWAGVQTDANGRVTRLDLEGFNDDLIGRGDGNNLVGPIPPELGQLTGLTELFLGSNALSGPIPATLGDLADLRWLSLSRNRLDGPIPVSLGDLANLETLQLYGNQLSGPIPAELARLANLQQLYLGGNGLSGPLEWLGSMTGLRRLELWGLGSTGPISAWLGNLTNLEHLDLSRNALSGPIPAWLGDLTSLRRLYLYDNPLTGLVPQSLTQLSFQTLWLHATRVCAPADAAFRTWIESIGSFQGNTCGEDLADDQYDRYRQTWQGLAAAGPAPANGPDADGADSSTSGFTDHPIEPGKTPLKAAHFRELRTRIAALRARAGLPAAQWTDPTLTPGLTPARRVHLTELRTALDAVYDAAARPRPSYTDAAVTAGATTIEAVHLTELRAAVVALE